MQTNIRSRDVSRGDNTDTICEFYIEGVVTGGEEAGTDYHACIYRFKETGVVGGHMSNGHFEGERTREIPPRLARALYLFAFTSDLALKVTQ